MSFSSWSSSGSNFVRGWHATPGTIPATASCACDLLQRARRRFPFIERIFADAGYQGPKMAKVVAATGCWKLWIVKRSDLCFVALGSDKSSSAVSPGSAATAV
jgi:hypothetical protein